MFHVFAFLDTHLGQIKVPTLTVPLLVFWVSVLKHLGICVNALKRGLGNWARIMVSEKVKIGWMIIFVI